METRSSTVMDKRMSDKISTIHVILSVIDGQWNQLRYIVVDPYFFVLSFFFFPFSFSFFSIRFVSTCHIHTFVLQSGIAWPNVVQIYFMWRKKLSRRVNLERNELHDVSQSDNIYCYFTNISKWPRELLLWFIWMLAIHQYRILIGIFFVHSQEHPFSLSLLTTLLL